MDKQERAVVVPALHIVAAAAELGGEFTRVDFQRMFQLFAANAFRIETRDRYDVAAEAPAIAEFEATGRIIIYQGKQDYLDLITGNAAAGRTIRRVHTVHAELDAYRGWQADAWRVAVPLPEFVDKIVKAA